MEGESHSCLVLVCLGPRAPRNVPLECQSQGSPGQPSPWPWPKVALRLSRPLWGPQQGFQLSGPALKAVGPWGPSGPGRAGCHFTAHT